MRCIYHTREDLTYWLSQHARVCHQFSTCITAEEWLHDGDDDDGEILWMGLEKELGTWCATARVEELLALGMGYQHVQTFTSEDQVAMLVSEGASSSPAEVVVTGV